MKNIANFLFEIGILSKTPRSGFHFLGTGSQSVAEHVNRAVFVGYTLAKLDGTVDASKVIKMCLFHDLAEARVSDLNYVHQKYVVKKEEEAITDLAAGLPFGDDLKSVIHEYEERKTPESILAKDADNVEWIISLKEQVDIGNKRAEEWITPAIKRLKTKVAQELAGEIMKSESSNWWFGDKGNAWWVNRNK